MANKVLRAKTNLPANAASSSNNKKSSVVKRASNNNSSSADADAESVVPETVALDADSDDDELAGDSGEQQHSRSRLDSRQASVTAAVSTADNLDDEMMDMDDAAEVQQLLVKQQPDRRPPGQQQQQQRALKNKRQAVDAEDDEWEHEERETAREIALKRQLDATTTALEKIKGLYEELRELRLTEPEANEQEMKQLAQARFEGHEKTFAVYKQEIQSLKDKIEVLESRPYNVPDELPARPEDAARIEKLEADLKQSQVERSKLKRGYTDAVSRAKAAEESSAQTAERVDELEQANTQLQQALADERRTGTQQHAARTQELETEMRTLRQELDAEVEHSKSLQAKIKTAAVPAALLPPNTASTSAASSQTRTADASLERARAELEDIKCRMGLLEDLSGLAINAMKREPDGTATFNCMMTDCFAEIGTFTFKIAFPPNGTQQYVPDVDPTRDAQIAALLPAGLRSFSQFPAERASDWFLSLFSAVNRLTPVAK